MTAGEADPATERLPLRQAIDKAVADAGTRVFEDPHFASALSTPSTEGLPVSTQWLAGLLALRPLTQLRTCLLLPRSVISRLCRASERDGLDSQETSGVGSRDIFWMLSAEPVLLSVSC